MLPLTLAATHTVAMKDKHPGMASPEDWALGQELEAQRKYAKLSRAAIVERLGISLTHLRDIEAGRTSVKYWLLLQLCRAIGVELDVVLHGADARFKAEFGNH